MPEAWSRCLSGKGVTVAVVDRGVYGRHPDLLKNYVIIYFDMLLLIILHNEETTNKVEKRTVLLLQIEMHLGWTIHQ